MRLPVVVRDIRFQNTSDAVAIPISSPVDLDGDGIVGFDDLLIVLSARGPGDPPPAECPADLDGSGDVGFGDLLLVLSHWR